MTVYLLARDAHSDTSDKVTLGVYSTPEKAMSAAEELLRQRLSDVNMRWAADAFGRWEGSWNLLEYVVEPVEVDGPAEG